MQARVVLVIMGRSLRAKVIVRDLCREVDGANNTSLVGWDREAHLWVVEASLRVVEGVMVLVKKLIRSQLHQFLVLEVFVLDVGNVIRESAGGVIIVMRLVIRLGFVLSYNLGISLAKVVAHQLLGECM